jgi:hypothetical protein
MWDSR